MGFLLALGTALFKAASDVTTKVAAKQVPHSEVIIVIQRIVEAVVAIAVGILVGFVTTSYRLDFSPLFDSRFLFLVLVNAALNGVALYFYILALRIADISIVSPMSQLTPAILLITTPLMLGESVSAAGALGVLCVVAGSYCLGISPSIGKDFSFWKPIVSLVRERGVQYVVLTSAIYGITSNIDKLGVQASDAVIWTFATGVVQAGIIIIVLAFFRRDRFVLSSKQIRLSAIPGVTGGLGSLLQMLAISVWSVPYVIAVKRLSALVSVVSGRIVFKEMDTEWRLLGAAIMVAGTALILILG